MTTTLENITSEIISFYSQSLITEKENIDDMLDHINDQKQKYRSLTSQLQNLDALLSQVTWLDDLTEVDKILIKGIIAMGKEADLHFRKYYAAQRRSYASHGWFKEEFGDLKEAIELHLENVLEVEHIIFELRENKEFKALTRLVDDL